MKFSDFWCTRVTRRVYTGHRHDPHRPRTTITRVPTTRTQLKVYMLPGYHTVSHGLVLVHQASFGYKDMPANMLIYEPLKNQKNTEIRRKSEVYT